MAENAVNGQDKSKEPKPPKGYRVSWSRQPYESGLRGVVQSERGFELNVRLPDGQSYRRVGATGIKNKGWTREPMGYYWSASESALGIKVRNTLSLDTGPVKMYPYTAEGLEEAKRDLRAYVIAALEAHARASKAE